MDRSASVHDGPHACIAAGARFPHPPLKRQLPHLYPMPHILLLSSSIRDGRMSQRVTAHLERHINGTARHSVEVLDLSTLALPLFHERLKFMKDPPAVAVQVSGSVCRADGLILVAPEYNGSFPASLKNVIDLLNEEWKRKPVALVPVSSGAFGGTQLVMQLQFVLWKLRAWVVPGAMHVPQVKDQFGEDGTATDAAAWAKRCDALLAELEWAIEARARMA
jgi:NAD(P)H-dependent FMN reductase